MSRIQVNQSQIQGCIPSSYNMSCTNLQRRTSRMTPDLKTSLVASLESAAAKAGLVLVSVKQGADFHGQPTAVFELGLPGDDVAGRSLNLELSDAFDFDKPNLLPEMTAHLAGEAKRLRNPRPDCYVTLGGLPLAFGKFQWPFHRSTSGADTHIVHGEIQARRRRRPRPARQNLRQRHPHLRRNRARHGAALRGDLRLQRDPQNGRHGPARVREVGQPPARSRHHALLQPLAKEVHLY